jgi:hypothetical protein
MASITIVSDGVEEKYALEAPTVTLGRGLESDIRLKDIKSSRRHCQIVKTGSGYQCVDLNSGNGTYVNGVQIKQQSLQPGDKIQIGSTTITFQDGGGAAKAPPPKTAAAAAAAPAERQRAGAATAVLPKPATGPVPASSATRKITTRAAAVSGPAKPSTQAIAKEPTQPVSKSGTGRVGKATQRVPGSTTRSGLKASATQRFKAEGRKKKVNPVTVIFGLIGVIFIAVIVFIFLPGGGDPAVVDNQLKELRDEIAKLDAANNYDGAIAKYKQALAMMEGNEKYKGQMVEVKGAIKELEIRKDLMASADRRFADAKKKAEEVTNENADEVFQALQKLDQDYAEAKVSWKDDLKKLVGNVQDLINKRAKERQKLDFDYVRKEIGEKHLVRGKENWSDAVKAWQEYLKAGPADDARAKVDGEIAKVNGGAKAELLRLQTRADNLSAEKKTAEALDLLKGARKRFERTAHADELEKLIGKLEK